MNFQERILILQRWLRNHLPDKKTTDHYPSLGRLRTYLRHPNLWYINRFSISRGVAIGLFVAFIPLPMQMLIAGILAILFRANVPIAIVITWLNNPFTFVPINYFIYRVGAFVLGKNVEKLNTHIDFWKINLESSFTAWISQFSKVYFVGLSITAIGAAVMGYCIVLVVWPKNKIKGR